LDVSDTTIMRELARNADAAQYTARRADQTASKRRRQASSRDHWPDALWRRIVRKLKRQWSPEEIVGWLAKQDIKVSAEGIYRRIRIDAAAGGSLHRHLRRGRKQRR